MPEQAPTQSRTTSTQAAAPTPVAPVDGALADARAAAFEWETASPTAESVLQIATDPDFRDVVLTIPAGENTALTVYNTLDRHAGTDLFWRVGTGEGANWGEAATFHAATAERLAEELASRDRQARLAAQQALQKHLEHEHRMPVVLPEQTVGDRHAAVILGAIVVSFLILLVILFIFGQITYPAEAVV